MLEELQVSNLGVIGEAHLIFGEGMHVVTGETGAGKTLIVEALNLITGARPDTTVIGPDSGEAVIEASFSGIESNEWAGEGDNLVVTRVISNEGRNRLYVNGRLASVGQLRDLVSGVIAINGQSGALGLLSQRVQLAVLDRSGDGKLDTRYSEYRAAFASLESEGARRDQYGGDPRERAREMDLLRYQVAEIDAAGIEPGEDERLLNEAARLSAVAELRATAMEAWQAAVSAADQLSEMDTGSAGAAGADPALEQLLLRGGGLAVEVRDLGDELRRYSEVLEEDPERLGAVNERLELVASLKRKYGPAIEDIVEFGIGAGSRLEELESFDEASSRASLDYSNALTETLEAARCLSAARKVAASRLAAAVREHLSDLDLGGAVFEIALESRVADDGNGLGAEGADSVAYMFSANPGIEAKPVSKIASGGELSRLMLAIELAIAGGERETAMVFDEVDAGIGGATAIAVADKLSALSDHVQVLCVTHLAQVASRAEKHYRVVKAGGRAKVEVLDAGQRRDEIGRMLAGTPESAHALRHASELLEAAHSHRGERRARAGRK